MSTEICNLHVDESSHKDVSTCVCVCVRTREEILRHVTAGGPMPTVKDGAERETTVATATQSWSG